MDTKQMINENEELIMTEYENIKNFLVDRNQRADDYIDEAIRTHINKVILYNTMFITHHPKRYERGFAFLNHNQILVYTDKINFSSEEVIAEIDNTIIHELTHILLFFFPIFYGEESITKHTLEFAIMNYVLFYQYTNEPIFFNRYDFHEEPNYEKLKIDRANLDRFISTIKFENLNELYLKSVKYAQKIRSKF